MQRVLIRTTLATLMLAVAVVTGQAAEQAPDASSESDAELDRRIQFLEERLDDSRTHGQIWHWSWLTINGGSMIGNGIGAALTDDHDDTVQFATGATLGAIGLTNIFLRPMEARFGSDPVRGLPQGTREEKLAKLRAAEDQLRRNAERSEGRWSPAEWTGNVVLAAAAGTVVAVWGDESEGIVQFASTFLGGTANLLTQPWGPKDDWEAYLASTGKRSAGGPDLDVVVSALEDGGKVGLKLSW